MKISNMGVDYKVKRSKNCTGCAGYRAYDLCNELKAQFFGKAGFSCTKQGGAYNMVEIPSSKRKLEQRLKARQMLVSDKTKHALLTSYLAFIEALVPNQLSETDAQTLVVIRDYHKKIRKAFNIKPKGEQDSERETSN